MSALFQFMDRLRFSRKIIAGFSLLLVLMVISGAVSIYAVQTLGGTVATYREISASNHLLKRIQENIYNMRMHSLKYRVTGDEAHAVQVNAATDAVLESEAQLIASIDDPGLRNELLVLKDDVETYHAAFQQAAALQRERLALGERLDTLGPQMRETLTTVTQAAFAGGNLRAAKLAGEAQQSLILGSYHASRYQFSNAEADYERAMEALEDGASLANTLASAYPDRATAATGAANALEEYRATFRDMATLIRQRNVIYTETLDDLGPQLIAEYETIIQDMHALQAVLGEEADVTAQSVFTLILVLTGVILALAIVIANGMAAVITRSIRELVDCIARLAGGEYSLTIYGTERNDEIGDIARGLESFRDNLVEKERKEAEARAIAQREERKRVMAALADEFQQGVQGVIQTVASAATELSQMASHMQSLIENTSDQTSQASNASGQTSSNVQSVAAAVEQLSVSVNDISMQIQKSNGSVQSSREKSDKASESAKMLEDTSTNISAVVELINDIAEQINLLALNATIESARAGEAGKGFAVVANEVKNLADQTGKATQEISSKILELQSASREVVANLEEINVVIGDVSNYSSSIASAVEEQSATTREIAANMNNAAQGTQSMNGNIVKIQQVSGEATTVASEVLTAAGELSRQAESMNQTVHAFLDKIRAG